MVAVPFPAGSAPGKFAESGGRMINAMAEKLPDGRVARRRVPGIAEIAEIAGFANCRGAIEINGVLLAAVTDRLITISKSGGVYTLTTIGNFTGNERVYFARNNQSPTPTIAAVTNSTAYVIDLSSGASGYPDPDVGSPNSVTSQGAYFVFSYGNARMRASGLNSTSINTLDTAFAESKPDGLLRVVAIGKNLLACGSQTIEIWPNTGNPTGFPFSYLDTIPRGVAGPDAIAGFENEWSNTIIFAGNDGVVYRLNGYSPEPISNASVATDIGKLTESERAALVALVYSHRGHSIWALKSPYWTWCFDLSTGEWFERKSHGRETWRSAASVACFGGWVVGDETTGKFGLIDQDERYEFDDPLRARVVSSTMSGFPVRAIPSRLVLDIMAGVGEATGIDPIGVNPQCSISWSKDGGATFGSPVLREMGRQGQYKKVVAVNRLGMASTKGIQIAVDVSDPVDFTLFSGDLQVEAAA